MTLSCLGFGHLPGDNVLPENALRVLFAGWASFVIQDADGQPRICGEYSPEEESLVEALKAELADRSKDPVNKRIPFKLFGWESLQGFLTPQGEVYGLSNDASPTVRLYYRNALDVAVCGNSTDHLTVVIDALTGHLYQWTASTPRFVNASVSADTNVQFEKVWAGESHVLALATDGTLYSWGSGRHGQLGHGDLASEPSPKPIETLQGIRIVDAACGAAFSVALSEAGDIYSFGLNDHGQLGLGRHSTLSKTETEVPRRNTAYPQLVDFYDENQNNNPIDVTVSKVACGRAHTVVLDGKAGGVRAAFSEPTD
ncbi:hypothetical protein BGX34_003086 [Mortierella sp. NVP85]|nr:hypothetical protein BGX34_003086 [Mortierella sp. NVP85]